MNKVRIDKWIWSVRIFKSRSKFTDACKSGKVKINELNVKPSLLVTTDTVIHIRKNGFDLQFKILKLIEKRVSATLAQECYEDLTPTEELNKYKAWFIGKAGAERRERGAGRPTKKERRELDEHKDDYYDYDFD